MELEKATTEHIELLLEFAEKTFRAAFEAMNDPEDFNQYCRKAFTRDKFLEEMQSGQSDFWLGWVEGELAAYLKLNFDTHTDAVPSGKTLQIERLYVDPGFQDRGYGATLLEFCQEQAKIAGAECIWLTVWQMNPRAVRFYERHGYVSCGTKVFQLGDDPQVDWVMRKELIYYDSPDFCD